MKYQIVGSTHDWCACEICAGDFDPRYGLAVIGEGEYSVCQICLARSPARVAAIVAKWRDEFQKYQEEDLEQRRKCMEKQLEQHRRGYEKGLARCDRMIAELAATSPTEWQTIANERGRWREK